LSKGNKKSKQYQVQVIAERCKGCGFCIEFCPQNALSKSAGMNSKVYHNVDAGNANTCTGCDMCSMVCPDFAISVMPIKEKPDKEAEVARV